MSSIAHFYALVVVQLFPHRPLECPYYVLRSILYPTDRLLTGRLCASVKFQVKTVTASPTRSMPVRLSLTTFCPKYTSVFPPMPMPSFSPVLCVCVRWLWLVVGECSCARTHAHAHARMHTQARIHAPEGLERLGDHHVHLARRLVDVGHLAAGAGLHDAQAQAADGDAVPAVLRPGGGALHDDAARFPKVWWWL